MPIDQLMEIISQFEAEDFDEVIEKLHGIKEDILYEIKVLVEALYNLIRGERYANAHYLKKSRIESLLLLCEARQFYKSIGNRNAVGICANNIGNLLCKSGR